LRAENRFGVVAIREGAEVGAAITYEHGTSAEIVDWHQESGGMLGILAAGREPFQVVEVRREADGLYVGDVVWLDAPLPQPLPAAHAPLRELARRLVEPLPQYRGVVASFDDAGWVGGRLLELLPLAVSFKQALLETPDVLQRLERIAEALRSRGHDG
jgi:Lon protease-like protein